MTKDAHDWSNLLDQDEVILWQGTPTRKLFLFQRGDLFAIPFTLVWVAGPVFIVAAFPEALLLVVPGLFILVGAHLLVGRFLWDAWQRRGTHYALTNKRALIHRSRPGRHIREQPLHPSLPLSLDGKHRGTVTFGNKYGSASSARNLSISTEPDGWFMFREIEDPQAVYEMSRAAMQAR